MNQISNSTACTSSISSETRLGMTWVVMAGMVGLLLIVTPMAWAEQTATESVKSTIDKVIQILNSEPLKQPSRSVERRRQIEHVIRQRVNYEDMAKQALGWPWTELTDHERQKLWSCLFSCSEMRLPVELTATPTSRCSICLNSAKRTMLRYEQSCPAARRIPS